MKYMLVHLPWSPYSPKYCPDFLVTAVTSNPNLFRWLHVLQATFMATRKQREQNALYTVQMKPHMGLTFLTDLFFIAVSLASKEKDSV